jgi:putative solute:sodium symporter small subunit
MFCRLVEHTANEKAASTEARAIERGDMAGNPSERRQVHWAKTRRLTLWVLLVWFVFSLLTPWFARELDAFSFMGFKLGYYLIVQGSLIVFVVLIVVQNLIQDRIDDQYGAGSID